MTSIVAPELDYKPVDVSHGTYQFSKSTPQVSLDAVDSISTAGGEETIFELPSKVMNLGKSILSFQANPTVVTTYKWMHADSIAFIRQLQLYTKEGLYLCDIQDFNMYMKCINRKSNRISDVQTFDKPAAAGDGYFGGIFCGNSAAQQDLASQRPDRTPCKTSFIEPAYCIGGGADGTATPVINIQIPLSRIVDSIVGQDRDQYFGESVYLRIVWAPATDVYWKSTSATNPVEGGAVTFDGNITVSNLVLYTAIEQNPLIVESLRQKFMSGDLKYNVPYVYMNNQSLTGTAHNLQVRYSRAHGSKLKKIIWGPFSATNTKNLKYDNSNLAGTRVADFYTMINNVRNTQYNYVPATGNDWLDHKDKLVGSSILSSNEFRYNYTHVEDFTGALSTNQNPNIYDGLPLDTEVKYDIQATTAGALKHYIYAVTLKTLTLSPNGAVFT
jgi:hypothetical protein